MKKLFSIVLCLVLAFSLAACGGTTETDTEVETDAAESEATLTTVTDGVLTVGMEIGYPPFESYASDGVTPIGLDVDLAKAIADKLGLEVQYLNTAFDTILSDGLGTNYDCVISAVTINDERLEQVLFSTPYIQNYQTVVVKAGSDLEVTGFESLEGHSVAVQSGTTSYDLLTNYNDTDSIHTTLVANEQVLSAFTQLSNGEVDFVLCDSSVANNYVTANPDVYEIAWTQDTDAEEFGVAISKSNPELQEAINEAMAELEAEGVLDELVAAWIE
ncbi:MAG: transporter substrate-binding domain-containing protein [Clostridia bacterium]|nr:transporter substrate-binding domain-containing protein [Clostridia bacterium]